MAVADRQTETKPPPSEAHRGPADAKTDQPGALHHDVQTAQQAGNLKPHPNEVNSQRENAEKLFGKVELTNHDHAKSPGDKPGEPAKPGEPPKSADKTSDSHNQQKPAEGGFLGWMKSTVASTEAAGESALHNAGQAIHNRVDKVENTISHAYDSTKQTLGHAADVAEHKIGQMASTVEHKVESVAGAIEHKGEQVVAAVTDKNMWHNVGDVGKTLASGVGDAAVKTVKDIGGAIESGAVGAAHGVEKGYEWAKANPGKAAAIAAVGIGIGVAEVATGGLATPFIAAGAEAAMGTAGAIVSSSAFATGLEAVAGAAAATGTIKAGFDVAKHGELGTMMNQQNETPEAVAKARQQLKTDTGSALLGDAMLGTGYAIKGVAALRAGASSTEAAGAESGAANAAARTGDAAKAPPPLEGQPAGAQPRPVEAQAHPTEGQPHPTEGQPHPADAPHEVPPTAAKIGEEIADGGSVAAEAVGLMDRVRSIASGAYTHFSGLQNAASTVKNSRGIWNTATSSYQVATPQEHGTDKRTAPDEQTKH